MTGALYPGTFDPITNGHHDLVRRAVDIFGRVVVAIAANPGKAPLFTVDERVELAREVLSDIPNVEVTGYTGLTVDFAVDLVGVYRLEARAVTVNGRGNGALAKLGAVREAMLRQSFTNGRHTFDQYLWSILAPEWRAQRTPPADAAARLRLRSVA